MSLFEWLTIAVSLAIGFGGALLGGRIQRKQAADQRLHVHLENRRQESKKRLNALLDYERALREEVVSLEGSEYGMSNMPRPKDLKELMKAAYPYFHDLRDAEDDEDQVIYWRLFDPGAGDHVEIQDYIRAYAEACEAASELVSRFKRTDALLYAESAAESLRTPLIP